jgi:hypothetical protein
MTSIHICAQTAPTQAMIGRRSWKQAELTASKAPWSGPNRWLADRATRFSRVLSMFLAVLLFSSGCGGGREESNKWDETQGPASEAGLDLAADSIGNLYVAATSSTGSIQFASSSTPKNWSTWRELPDVPADGFDATTAPVLAHAANKLLAFGRGADDNIYAATKPSGADWTPWRAATTDASVKGTMSATSTGPSEAHIVYSTDDGCRYRRLVDGTLVESIDWSDCVEATITAVGPDIVGVALRLESRLQITIAERASNWAFSEPWAIYTTSYEISDLVYLNGSYHLVYAHQIVLDDVQPSFAYELRHLSLNFRSKDVQSRAIDRYEPSGNVHAAPALAVYRDRLVATWTTPNGYVNGARWDVADPQLPWIVYHDIGWGAGKLRPQLVAANRYLSPNQYLSANYGNDLHAAVLSKASPSRPSFITISRAMMRPNISDSFALYDASSGTDTPQRNWNLWRDHRPVITEIGFNLWMLPNWFVRKLYLNVVKWMCDTGNWHPEDDPCTSRRLPVYIQSLGSHYYNYHGAWVDVGGSAIHIWEETGHYAALALGMGTDNDYAPDEATAERTGLSLGVLKSGRSLFSEGTGICTQSSPRCPGFTGHSNNYDAGGLEHSFLYTVYYYLNDPSALRSYVNADLANGNNLLKRKYEWVRVNIFRGVEF